jgi:hypothetical protein
MGVESFYIVGHFWLAMRDEPNARLRCRVSRAQAERVAPQIGARVYKEWEE